MYSYGKRSVQNINTVNVVLQILAQKIIIEVSYDIGILDSGGFRTASEQNKIFKAKNSECDGYHKKSYHQTGMAIDFVPYVDGKFTWSNKKAFLSNAKTILEMWEEMKKSGRAKDYYLHWGGYWGDKDLNNNKLLEITDKLGWDMAHFELRKVKQENTMKISI